MSIGRKFLKYYEIVKINWKNVFAYPLQVFLSTPIFLLHIFLFFSLYTATYVIGSSSTISGFSLAQTLWLLVLTYVCDSTYGGKWSRAIDEEVRSGALAYSLNRPFSYALYHFFAMFGTSFPRFIINFIIGAAVTSFLVGPLLLTPIQIVASLLCIFAGCVLNFLINFCIGLGALWLEDTDGIVWIVSKSRRVLGGHMIPLYFLPTTVKTIAENLPFSAISYSPSLLMVAFSPELFLKVITVQGAWIAILGLLSVILFKSGMKNVSINGG